VITRKQRHRKKNSKRDSVDATVAALRAEGLDVAGVACHVGDASQRAALVAAALDAFGPAASIDVLVSNAAVNPTAGPLVDTPLDALDKIMDINVKAALALVQEAAPHMRRGGRVVLISSVTAYK
jgi:dehydrogenase/reductase SDR family protein 4